MTTTATLDTFLADREAVRDAMPSMLTREQQRYLQLLLSHATHDIRESYAQFGPAVEAMYSPRALAAAALAEAIAAESIIAREKHAAVVHEYIERHARDARHPGAWTDLSEHLPSALAQLCKAFAYYDHPPAPSIPPNEKDPALAALYLNKRR